MDKLNVDEHHKMMITAEYPTPIVEDFRTYLNHLTSYPIKLTKAKGYFTKKDLDLCFIHKWKSDKNEVPQQATQIGYPIIHLFYHLSLALDFIRIQRSSILSSCFDSTRTYRAVYEPNNHGTNM